MSLENQAALFFSLQVSIGVGSFPVNAATSWLQIISVTWTFFSVTVGATFCGREVLPSLTTAVCYQISQLWPVYASLDVLIMVSVEYPIKHLKALPLPKHRSKHWHKLGLFLWWVSECLYAWYYHYPFIFKHGYGIGLSSCFKTSQKLTSVVPFSPNTRE